MDSNDLLSKWTSNQTNLTLMSNISHTATPSTGVDSTMTFLQFLKEYYIWIIFIFGFPGNVASVCVVVRMSWGHVTTPLLFVGILAVVDNVVIILKIIGKQVVNGKVPVNDTSCQFLFFFGLTLSAFANWILVVISAERFTVIKSPLKVKLVWSMRKSLISISTVFLLLSLIHVHIFFTTSGVGYSCTVIPRYMGFYFPYWFAISTTLYAFLPAVSLTVFNILIIHMLRRLRVERCHLRISSIVEDGRRERQDRQMTIMLVALALVFICLTVPRCVYILFSTYLSVWSRDFLDTLTSSIADTNHAVNFYLYFLMGRRFREFVYNTITCPRHQTSGQRSHGKHTEWHISASV